MPNERRRPGERVQLAIRGRVASMTAEPGEPIIGAPGDEWSVEAVDPGCLRFRWRRTRVDLPMEEIMTAVVRAVDHEYDDDFGRPLVETGAINANGEEVEGTDQDRIFGNERFTVHCQLVNGGSFDGPLRLSVHDHQRSATIPWRMLQRIKNEIAGPERWACEWYPDEAHLIDEANERHLWVWPCEQGAPPAWIAETSGRQVSGPEEARTVGAVQDPLPSWYPEAGTMTEP